MVFRSKNDTIYREIQFYEVQSFFHELGCSYQVPLCKKDSMEFSSDLKELMYEPRKKIVECKMFYSGLLPFMIIQV